MSARRVMLVHATGAAMGVAHRWADTMAAMLGAELVVARLGRWWTPRLNVLFPRRALDEGCLFLDEALRELRVLERWSTLRARTGFPLVRATPVGANLDELVSLCREHEPDLLVLPASWAHRASWLARRSRAAVLVAQRPVGGRRALLAATDLAHPARPVLRQAAAIAERLRSPLTVVHNQAGFAAQLQAAGVSGGLPLPDDRLLADEQRRRLREELEALGFPAEVEITRRLDNATGILEAASRCNADLIVVGTQPARWFADRVCERICCSTDRSVLLVPVRP